MLYLEKFVFPNREHDDLLGEDPLGSFFDDHTYPFHLTSEMGLWSLDFEPITILYGGNGSGKSTIINVISQKLNAQRRSMFNSGPYFEEYVERCYYKATRNVLGDTPGRGARKPQKYDISKITTVLTSDDIFQLMLEQREENDRKLQKGRFLMDEFRGREPLPLPKHINFETGYNVDRYLENVEINKAKAGKRSSFNKLLIKTVGKMERGFSNGETALMKLSELLETPGLYLLDEPENSMSCEFQMKLTAIISYLARYGKCQFLISTHSPFVLSMQDAKIYNLDHYPVDVCNWWELENMKRYFQLFYDAKDRFLKN